MTPYKTPALSTTTFPNRRRSTTRRRGYAFMYDNADDWDVIRDSHEKSMRAAVGIKSRIHFNRYYLAPMLEKGLVVRTDPEHPNSPHQEYERI